MSDRFAARAERFAALSATALGWRPHEFWRATPAELALSLGHEAAHDAPPSRAEILRMIERDRNDERRC